MTDIRDAITALRTLLEALPEYLRDNPDGDPATWAAVGPYVVALNGGVVAHAAATEVDAYIATVASPDVTEALARLLDTIEYHHSGECGCETSSDCNQYIDHAAAALAAAITRRSTP